MDPRLQNYNLLSESLSKLNDLQLFDLPLYYQYGVGSPGFGVWRELLTHQMTTDWVLSDRCPNFPLLYHWRIRPLKDLPLAATPEQQEELEKTVQYWGNSSSIKRAASTSWIGTALS